MLFLFGPTGVGKTDILASGIFHDFEIISADSLQVYRDLQIGTAKPEAEVLDRVPHHMINILDPHELFSVGDFVERADKAVKEIVSRGKTALISGGTAFYFRSFMFGLPEVPKADPVVRKDLNRNLEVNGIEALYRELSMVDPERAAELHPHDRARIFRALEIYRTTGRPQSSWKVPCSPRAGYRFLSIGLRRKREELYKRIEERVDRMFELGLEQEVYGLMRKGYDIKSPAMKGIGYKEFFTDPEDPKKAIKKNSRRYAKRQMTFFSSLPDVHWVHPEETDKIAMLTKNFFQLYTA